MKTGSLTVLGTGIKAVGQATLEAVSCIQHAEKLLFLVADPVTTQWLRDLNPTAESLFRFYADGKPRQDTYEQMVECILDHTRSGRRVCVAFYGHPGIFAFPGHEAIRRARAEGYPAVMLPGVSAEDCLVADLGVDPGEFGSQSYEATDFLLYRGRVDPRAALILWQVGLVGHAEYRYRYGTSGLLLLAEALAAQYGGAHETIIYEAALYPACTHRAERVRLDDLPKARISAFSTLYVPPSEKHVADRELARRLASLLPKHD